VLNIGPGKLSMDNSDLPLRLTGEAKLGEMIFTRRCRPSSAGRWSARSWRFTPGRCCVRAGG
jgi:hypothetical protein